MRLWGIELMGIYGIRDIWAKNEWDTGYSDPPPPFMGPQ